KIVRAAVADARAEAEAILCAAREQADRERDQQLRELTAEARRQVEAELATAYLELERARRAALEEAEADVTVVAVAAARKIVAGELELHPEHIHAIVHEAIERV